VEGYRFSTEVQVRFAETDAQGIAHHAAFVVWLEVARVAWLAEHAGGYEAMRQGGIEALTTGVEVRYHRAARFDDRLRVWARCTDLRGARFRYEYAVERDGELVAEGSTSHATVDARTHRPVRLPAAFVAAVATAEGPSSSASSPSTSSGRRAAERASASPRPSAPSAPSAGASPSASSPP
jgi:acyl-CoA thioester hydrolase